MNLYIYVNMINMLNNFEQKLRNSSGKIVREIEKKNKKLNFPKKRGVATLETLHGFAGVACSLCRQVLFTLTKKPL